MSALTRPPAPAYADLAAALPADGRGNPINTKAHKRPCRPAGAFFASAASCYGGLCASPFGVAGFLCAQFPRAYRLPPNPVERTVTALITKELHMSNHAQGASAPSATSILRAQRHRRLALAALRADSSLLVRVSRYNAHMMAARHLEGRSHV